MSRITIDVAKEELEFIREALAQKYRDLISYLDRCEEESCKTKTPSVLEEAHHQLNAEIRAHQEELAEIERTQKEWTVTTKGDGSMVAKVKRRGRPAKKSVEAPYGYKKDGTPKQRPGRQAK